MTVSGPASRRLTWRFADADPARANLQLLSHLREASGPNRGSDSGHEV
jgi:hypothetical protein